MQSTSLKPQGMCKIMLVLERMRLLAWQVGDIIDDHSYPDPWSYGPTQDRASVLGEFGGLTLLYKDHSWVSGNEFGYEGMHNATELQVCKMMTFWTSQPYIPSEISQTPPDLCSMSAEIQCFCHASSQTSAYVYLK
jgi:hypothetical protein